MTGVLAVVANPTTSVSREILIRVAKGEVRGRTQVDLPIGSPPGPEAPSRAGRRKAQRV
jgi:hypothetical protein